MRFSPLMYRIMCWLTVLPLSTSGFAATDTTQPSSATTTSTQPAIERILVWGDSLSAAHGLLPEQGWVHLLETRLQHLTTPPIQVINGSLSGETTEGGLTRLPVALTDSQPQVMILELGGNDGLRGLPPTQMHKNLAGMIQLAQQKQIKVLLLGMKIPPNYGQAYTEQFSKVFSDLASEYKIPFQPFFLEEVALKPELMQTDGIHPNAQAQEKLLDAIWPSLEPLLLTK